MCFCMKELLWSERTALLYDEKWTTPRERVSPTSPHGLTEESIVSMIEEQQHKKDVYSNSNQGIVNRNYSGIALTHSYWKKLQSLLTLSVCNDELQDHAYSLVGIVCNLRSSIDGRGSEK